MVDTGPTIGIVVGVLITVGVIVFLIYWFFFRKKKYDLSGFTAINDGLNNGNNGMTELTVNNMTDNFIHDDQMNNFAYNTVGLTENYHSERQLQPFPFNGQIVETDNKYINPYSSAFREKIMSQTQTQTKKISDDFTPLPTDFLKYFRDNTSDENYLTVYSSIRTDPKLYNKLNDNEKIIFNKKYCELMEFGNC